MDKIIQIIEDILDEKEKVLATTNWKVSTTPFVYTVMDFIIYATNKRLILVIKEVYRSIYELPYYRITSIELVSKGLLFFKKRYYQIDGDLNDKERKLWRIPADAENVDEFVEIVKKMIGVVR